MRIIKLLFFWLIQWTWALPQNILGLIYSLKMRRYPKQMYKGALVTWHEENWGGVSLGMFLIINGKNSQEWKDSTLVHEYGHAIQSLILGPFYLLVIGLPSLIWCNSKKWIKYREDKQVSYFDFYPEKWANILGEKITGKKVSN